jgi:hypothetical protein
MWTHTTWQHPLWGKAAHLTISVSKEASDIENIAKELYLEAQSKLSEEGVRFIMAGYDETSPFYYSFYSEKGYTPWYGYSSLIYTGQRQPDNHLTMRLYQGRRFLGLLRCLRRVLHADAPGHGYPSIQCV